MEFYVKWNHSSEAECYCVKKQIINLYDGKKIVKSGRRKVVTRKIAVADTGYGN